MKRSVSRCTALIAVLVLTVIAIQLYSLKLLYKLENAGSRDLEEADSHASWVTFDSLPKDQTGSYRIKFNFAHPGRSDTDTNKKDVAIITQCSPNHLHNLIALVERWQGYVSVAVFITADFLDATHQLIFELRDCSPSIKSRISFHTVYPVNSLPAAGGFDYSYVKLSRPCREALNHARNLPGVNYGLANIPYPNNLLRNVARKKAGTTHVLVIDVDMLPNKRLHGQINAFISSGVPDMAVYVLPAFELMDGVDVPEDKSQLLHLFGLQKVRPFYAELCWKCQKHTDYDRWLNLAHEGRALKPAYEVFWKDAYEPFYVSSNSVSFYDERFKQYGFNRISQVCELHISGHAFFVLDKVFVIHQGFKVKERFHSSKDGENAKNKILYKQLQQELARKYPHSKKTCI